MARHTIDDSEASTIDPGEGASITLGAPAKVNLALAVSPPVMEVGPRKGWHEIASWFAPIDLADTLTVERRREGALSTYAIHWAPPESAPPESAPPESAPPESAPPESAPPESAPPESASPAPRPTPIDWPITKDLAVRAHLLLERETGRSLPVRMRLEKRIPVGGGLGGGSSDGAAMLRAVNELFGLGLSMERLRELSRELGSDVAFFLEDARGGESAVFERARSARDGVSAMTPTEGPPRSRSGLVGPRPAFVSGFGDRIERVARVAARASGESSESDATRAHLVLVFPEFGCPTAPVYKAFDSIDPATLRPGARFEERAGAARALAERGALDEAVSGELFNDLAPAAEAVAPALKELRDAIRRATQCEAHVTGSGSTCFVVARDGNHARWMRDHCESIEGSPRAGVASL